ncbi:MAG: indole-3-glycerol phosphate synthase TrpC [Cyclobacteriaceae bacterium]|nr:indole-3-glycerol phosphate synthase TrpC [Cyclobacteriaceae bacterium]
MANILDKIIATKKREVAKAQRLLTVNGLQKIIETNDAPIRSLARSLRLQPGIIAEFKRASPSKGIINEEVNSADIIKGYDVNGAAGISVLTDVDYFKAQETDFSMARKATSKPLLRKEFIIDEYQIYQSKAMEADVILLIAAVLTAQEIKNFTTLAHQLNLEVLIELHEYNEIEKLCGNENIIGVNNRNLKTFEVDINQSIKIKNQLGNTGFPLISESGLSSIIEVEQLLSEGFSGFLMGEYFMRQKNPAYAFSKFNNLLKQLTKK